MLLIFLYSPATARCLIHADALLTNTFTKGIKLFKKNSLLLKFIFIYFFILAALGLHCSTLA